MKNPTKRFMQVDFNSIKILGLKPASLLSYLIYKSDKSNKVCCPRNVIMQDLCFSLHDYRDSIKVLVSKGLMNIENNHVSRLNAYRLNEHEINTLFNISIGMGDTNDGMGDTNDGMGDTNDGMGDTTIKQEISNKETINPSAKADLVPQAEARVLSVVDFNSVDEYLAYIRIQERKKLDIQQDLSIDFTDTAKDVKAKAKIARKARKQDIQPDDKWSSFLSFIKDEFSILYPKHRNRDGAIKTSLEFALDPRNSSMTDIEIANLVTQIKNHYLVYCEQNEFAVGPTRYINDRMWTTALNNKVDPNKKFTDPDYYKSTWSKREKPVTVYTNEWSSK